MTVRPFNYDHLLSSFVGLSACLIMASAMSMFHNSDASSNTIIPCGYDSQTESYQGVVVNEGIIVNSDVDSYDGVWYSYEGVVLDGEQYPVSDAHGEWLADCMEKLPN